MFDSVKRQGKIPQLIGDQIKNSILDGLVKPGERLPTERELVNQFQASRIAVREALKSLEASGLITIRPGAGTFVNEVTSKPLSRSLSSLLRFQKSSINEVTEARVVFEPDIAKLAAERITEEDLLRLEENIHQAEEIHSAGQNGKPSPPATERNIEFHSLIAESTHNSVIHFTMRTLFDVLKEMTSELNDNPQRRAELSKRAVAYHKMIVKALRERNGKKAQELVLKDVLRVQGGFKEIGCKSR